MRQFINIVESHLTEIDRGNGDLADDDHWEQVKRGEFEPRQHDMFSNDDNDYALQGHFDGFDVATMNTNRTGRAYVDSDDVTYVLFRTATPVAYISLRNYMAADNDYQVSAIRIDPTEQGKGLSPRFYHWLLTDGSISRLYALPATKPCLRMPLCCF